MKADINALRTLSLPWPGGAHLRAALDKYLSMRKGLGYKYEH